MLRASDELRTIGHHHTAGGLTRGSWVVTMERRSAAGHGEAGVNPRDPTSQHLLASLDKADAVTLVLEFPRNREASPAALLALIFVGWRANSRGHCHSKRGPPNPYRVNHGVTRRIDHGDGTSAATRHVRAAVRGDRDHQRGRSQLLCGNHRVARRVDYRDGGAEHIRHIGADSV